MLFINPLLMKAEIFGHRLDSMTSAALLEKVQGLVERNQHGFITFCNVHMTMEAAEDPRFAQVLQESIFNLTDGMPLVNHLKNKGLNAHRTAGPDMMPMLCELAEKENWPIGLYGGSEEELAALNNVLSAKFPRLNISSSISPPFRELSPSELSNDIDRINTSGAKLLFVGLGCPKQEKWMCQNQDAINAVMFGVGGAFQMLAGTKKRAPLWMQQNSLEWLYRFIQDPIRLWKRYVWLNFKFLWKLKFRS